MQPASWAQINPPGEPQCVRGMLAAKMEKQRAQASCAQCVNQAHYSVSATMPKGATLSDAPTLARNLLMDHFGMKFHVETRPTEVLSLTVERSGVHAMRAHKKRALELDRIHSPDEGKSYSLADGGGSYKVFGPLR
jgi:uncharacterized protein (TIGR03435 family)